MICFKAYLSDSSKSVCKLRNDAFIPPQLDSIRESIHVPVAKYIKCINLLNPNPL